jgi:hypothetical protein
MQVFRLSKFKRLVVEPLFLKSRKIKGNFKSTCNILRDKLVLVIISLVLSALVITPLHYSLSYPFLDMLVSVAIFPVGQLYLNILATAQPCNYL